MNTSYELLDLASGNVFDVYERESDALEVLIEIDLEHGHEAVKGFALLRDADGQSSLIAMEDDLVDRVQVEKESLIRVERVTGAVRSLESEGEAGSGRTQTWWRSPAPLVQGIVGGVRISGVELVLGGV